MRIQDVEAFMAVKKYGSLTQAAERLFVTQPTLSHQISNLEDELGVQLVIRRKGIRTVTLTPHGRAFVPQAEKLVGLLSETRSILQAAATESVTVSCVQSVLPFIMSDLNDAFHSLDNPCSFTLRGADSETAGQKLGSGIDIAICSQPSPELITHKSAQLVFQESMYFVCRADSPYRDYLSTSSLDVGRQFLTDWGVGFMDWQSYWFSSTGKPFMQTRNAGISADCFPSPDIWAILPSSIACELGPDFRCCELDYPPPPRSIYIVNSYPPKEPYRSLAERILKERFSCYPGVRLLSSPAGQSE